jgi:hypothetical protein
MDRTIKIQQLYSELSAMENALKDFVKPRSASHPHEWTQEEAEKHPSLIKHRTTSLLSLLNWKAAICSSNIELRNYPELKSRGSAPGTLWKPIGHLSRPA